MCGCCQYGKFTWSPTLTVEGSESNAVSDAMELKMARTFAPPHVIIQLNGKYFSVSLSEHQQINFRLGIKLLRHIAPTASARHHHEIYLLLLLLPMIAIRAMARTRGL